jgi:hypothetical protein
MRGVEEARKPLPAGRPAEDAPGAGKATDVADAGELGEDIEGDEVAGKTATRARRGRSGD